MSTKQETPPALGHFVKRDELELVVLLIAADRREEALGLVQSILGRRPRFPIAAELGQ